MDYLHIPLASFPDNRTTVVGRFGCQLFNGKLFVSLNIFMLLWREKIELTAGELFGHIETNIPTYIRLLGWSRDEIVLALTELHDLLAARPRDPLDSSTIDSGWTSPDHTSPSQPHAM
jgi:hypothetical protein